MLRVLALFLLTLAVLGAAKEKNGDHCAPPPGPEAPSLPAKLMDGAGKVSFPITTTSKEAQQFFEQGVAQMHSFWGREAERSFLQAAELDPEAPMPWWGVAMIAGGQYQPYFQIVNWDSINGKQPRTNRRAIDAAKKAIELSEKPDKATDLEKLYIAAVAARRIPNGKDPDDEYIQAWRRLLAKYPNEVEARTFLSLHLMRGFVLPEHTPREHSMEAVSILRGLLRDAPGHPGVHHYVIHAWEGSSFAAEAWPSCKRYFELAPAIPHALHMPGHIYSQTGRWSDAIIAFTAAKNRESSLIEADPGYGNGHHGHNVHYLSTSYSFSGDFDAAVREAQHLLGIPETDSQKNAADLFTTAYSQGFIAMMRALTQHQKWDLVLDGRTLPQIARPRQQAWYAWARGTAYAAKGNVKDAEREARKLTTALDSYKRKMKSGPPEELLVAKDELDAQILLARGKTEAGLRALERAAKKDRALRYTEPPYYARPVYEALGHWALKLGRLDLARTAYQQALDQFPEDAIALAGLRQLDHGEGDLSGGQ